MLAALLLNPVPPPGTGGWPTEQDRPWLQYRDTTYDDPRRKRRRLVTIIDDVDRAEAVEDAGGEPVATSVDQAGVAVVGLEGPALLARKSATQEVVAETLGIVSEIIDDDLLALLIVMDEI